MSETRNPSDGTVLSFEESGAGPSLLLVHGSGLSRVIWRGFGYVRALHEEFHVISVDLRGHGRSGKPVRPDDYRMPLIVEDIAAILDAVGVSAAHYFGYSFGARAGFSFLQQHPDRVTSLITAGGTHRAPSGSVGELFFQNYDRALASGGMPEFVHQWGLAAGRPIDPQTAAAFRANDSAALRAYFQQVEKDPGITDDALLTFTVPALLMAGSLDRRRYLDSECAAHLMVNAVFHSLPGRDHAHTLQPSEAVLAAVLPFLRSVVS